MTLENYRFREIPEYYDWMYLDGFTPDEILYALHEKMNRQQAEQEELADSVDSIKVKSEVKKKKQSALEKEIFSIMEKSMKTALDAAVDDLLKDWDKEIKIKL